MEEGKVEMLASNEKEWRKHILRELFEIKKIQSDERLKVNTLEVKMSVIAIVTGAAVQLFFKLIS